MKSSPQSICPQKAGPEPKSAPRGNETTTAPGSQEVNYKPGIVREWTEMIKLEHTLFALPFALSGLLLGGTALPTWQTVAWTVAAFTGARAAAMTLNRLIDATIDAKNPRTMTRAIPSGRIGKSQAFLFALASFALMIFSACHLPTICLLLSPIAVIWLSFYSFTKRFTWLCHIVLGIALGGAALGGWAAAGGSFAIFAPWLLALAVSAWVAGFDIIYALQDVDFDRKQALFSLPARFGVGKALTLSRCLHVITASSLLALGIAQHLGPVYFVGAAIVCVALIYEHSLVSEHDLSRIDAAFFTTNGVVSIVAFLSILIDKLIA